MDATSRGGNKVIIGFQSNGFIYGFYETDDGDSLVWVPCRWNLDGTFKNVENPRGLDITIEE